MPLGFGISGGRMDQRRPPRRGATSTVTMEPASATPTSEGKSGAKTTTN
jgi:hypothetical protein